MEKIKLNKVKVFCKKLSYKTFESAQGMLREREEARYCPACEAWHIYKQDACTKKPYATKKAASGKHDQGYMCSKCHNWHKWEEKRKKPKFLERKTEYNKIREIYGTY